MKSGETIEKEEIVGEREPAESSELKRFERSLRNGEK